jgi:hypothetical protein
MPGLVPGIHVLAPKKDVDGRDKPGHDENHQSELTTFTLGFMRYGDYNALAR